MSRRTHSSTEDTYDGFGWFYDRHWSGHYHPWAIQALDGTLLRTLQIRSRILDVCCGTGVVAAELSRRRYRIFGLDSSRQMLKFAFVCADAQASGFKRSFGGAIATFDSLNHFVTSEALFPVFCNVQCRLRRSAQFVVDVNLEGAYTKAWKRCCTTIDDEHASFIRASYGEWKRIAETAITLFRFRRSCKRTDITLRPRSYPASEILDPLHSAGFRTATCFDAAAVPDVACQFGDRRGVVVACTSDSRQEVCD